MDSDQTSTDKRHPKKLLLICEQCGDEFRCRRIAQRFCGSRCYGYSRRGSNNPSWKGGRYIDGQGYVRLFDPSNPRAYAAGYVFEHIVVLEAALGRQMLPGEVCHHIDGNRSNNQPLNLRVFPSTGAHSAFHAAKRKLSRLDLEA